MKEVSVSLHFSNEFSGTMNTGLSQVSIGHEPGQLMPYDMMLGALGSCFYANFLEIARKMRLDYESVSIDIKGLKRDEVPTTLQEVSMILTIIGALEQKGFQRAGELAAKYCSVHETISRVADMKLELRFALSDKIGQPQA